MPTGQLVPLEFVPAKQKMSEIMLFAMTMPAPSLFARMPRAPAPVANVLHTDWILFLETVTFETVLPR